MSSALNDNLIEGILFMYIKYFRYFVSCLDIYVYKYISRMIEAIERNYVII